MINFKIIYEDSDGKKWLEYVVSSWLDLSIDYDEGGNTLLEAKSFGSSSPDEDWSGKTDVFENIDG